MAEGSEASAPVVVPPPPETAGVPLDRSTTPAALPDTKQWMEGASEEHLTNPAFDRYHTKDAMLKGFVEQSKLLGSRELPPPAEGPTMPHAEMAPADREAFFKGLDGAVKSGDQYTRQTLDVPPGSIDPDLMKGLLGTAASVGIQDWQLLALQDTFQGGILAQHEALQAHDLKGAAEAVEVLQTEWHGMTERNITIAEVFLERNFGDKHPFLDLVMKREDGQGVLLKNTAEFIKIAYKAAMAEGTDAHVPTSSNGRPQDAGFAEGEIQKAYAEQRAGTLDTKGVDAVISRYGAAAAAKR